jgi:hypothetical protein
MTGVFEGFAISPLIERRYSRVYASQRLRLRQDSAILRFRNLRRQAVSGAQGGGESDDVTADD